MQVNMRILIATLIVVAALGEDFDPNFTYADFNRTFPRSYQGEQWTIHEAAFNKNYAELLRLHSEGKDVAVNEKLDWTDEQLKNFLNYQPQNLGVPPSTRPLMSSALFTSPTQFDWRLYGVVTPIKNQGSCGSCWSFSATAEYETKIAIATNGTLYDLSEQYLLKCQTGYSLGCNGGYPQRALQLANRTGIPLESAYPYNPSGPTGDICTNTAGRVKLNLTVSAVRFYYFQGLTVEQLQQDLVTYGPINVGVYASDYNFMYAGSSGVITCNSASTIDHAILLVGYNTTHWFVKNSWGTSWGHNGFGYISKNTLNDCNIRQYVNEMQVTFTQPQPIPDPGMINVTITMTDSAADGWNGNVISIKQNNNVVGAFGSAFTTGASNGPVYMMIQGNISAQIVVTQLGNKTNEVGFTIKAPNGTVLHQRNSGSTFTANALLQSFCIMGGCPTLTWVTVTMTDSGSDGWNSNILAFKQNNNIVGKFGDTFISGASSGPISIGFQTNLATQIVVTQLGSKGNEIGFVVKSANGTVLFSRTAGTTFDQSRIFGTFCPGSGCTNILALTISMTDSGSDGWNGNIISLKQNGSIVGTFGDAFTAGAASGPLTINVIGNMPTQVTVAQLGTKTNEIGFIIKAPNLTVIHQRNSGSTFTSDAIFVSFCPIGGCPDLTIYNLTVTMTDSYGDGWEGNVLAIRQNGVIKGTFGSTFTTGYSSGPVNITVQGAVEAQIIVYQLGTSRTEVGFVVTAPNSTVVYRRLNDVSFELTTVFRTFCLNGGCPCNLPYTTLAITLTDSYGDGWNSNVLAIKQNSSIVGTFGNTFTSGSSLTEPTYIVVQSNLATQIVVSSLGSKTNQVGFIVRATNGTIIYQRNNGTTFDGTKIFSIFCSAGGCSNMLTLTVTLSDTFGDGWNNNVLAIKQNNSIIGTFGDSFTTGSTTNPVSINVLGDLNAQIVVTQLGVKSDEVRFTVKASNGTTIYDKGTTSTFNATTIFLTFCPIGGCPDPNSIVLNITMTDSWGDGWQSNILAIKQNNVVVGTFGSAFTSGSTSGPVYITVQGSVEAQIVVYQFGTYTNQIGFTVKSSNGAIIYQRFSGATFNSTIIFATFCPAGGCPVVPNVTYYLTTTDSYGDGWEGTVLAFKQNGTVLYTFALTSGYNNNSIAYSFPKLQTVSATVYILGNYTNQVGFSLKNSQGNTVFEKVAGTKFFVNTLLGTFCPQCTNLSPVNVLPQTEVQKQPISNEETEYIDPDSTLKSINALAKSYMISTYVLGAIVLALGIVSFVVIYKLKKVQEELNHYKSEKSTQNSPEKDKIHQNNMTQGEFEVKVQIPEFSRENVLPV